jgi:hypothetical protein
MARTTSMFNTGSQLAWWSAWYPPSSAEQQALQVTQAV